LFGGEGSIQDFENDIPSGTANGVIFMQASGMYIIYRRMNLAEIWRLNV